MRTIETLIFLVLSLLVFSNCNRDPNPRILYDFETDAELDHLYWNCHTLLTLSSDHATHGSKSLKMELFPSDYPGLTPLLDVTDWRSYTEFCFDLYNPSGKPVRLGVRIDDRKDYPDTGERYNRDFILKQGNNHIVIPLAAVIASGSKRHLNLATIRRVFIYMNHPVKRTTLYVDTISLTQK
jgi:hypothetical protein